MIKTQQQHKSHERGLISTQLETMQNIACRRQSNIKVQLIYQRK